MSDPRPLYNRLTVEPVEALNQRAHVGGGTETVEVPSGEGLVEDQWEQHLKHLYVAYREPAATKIARLAQDLDSMGFSASAARVDLILGKFYSVGGLEATIQKRGAGGLWGGIQEDLETDVNDLVRVMDGLRDDPELAVVRSAVNAAYAQAEEVAAAAKNIQAEMIGFSNNPTAAAWEDLHKLDVGFGQSLAKLEKQVREIEEATGQIVMEPLWGNLLGRELDQLSGFVSVREHIKAVRADYFQLQKQMAVLKKSISETPSRQKAAPASTPPQPQTPTAPQAKQLTEEAQRWMAWASKMDASLNNLSQRTQGAIAADPALKDELLTPDFREAYRLFKGQLLPGLADGRFRFPDDEDRIIKWKNSVEQQYSALVRRLPDLGAQDG